ncbi:MAG: ABC transporter ATP-binding protein [Bacteriovoracia bacterium]
MSIIEAKNLSLAFGDHQVLSDINFTINRGSFTALLGKNGAGKSTILNILMGQFPGSKGDCKIFNEDIRKNPSHLKQRIGHVSENINFSYPVSVKEFIKIYGSLFINYDYGYFDQLVNDFEISINKPFHQYSRGQKMQIVLMAALAQRPELLLVDEITSVLDASARNRTIDLLSNFTKSGGTVILTTNIVGEIQNFCTHVMFLQDTKIKFHSHMSEVSKNFRKIKTLKPSPIITLANAAWIGTNSDGSQSYIVPSDKFSQLNANDFQDDRRALTLVDIYNYHGQRIQE